MAPNSIRNRFTSKLLPGLPEVLGKEQPAPKPEAASAASMGSAEGKQAASTGKVDEGRGHCPFCQSGRVWMNGLYYVIYWLVFLSLHWSRGDPTLSLFNMWS